MLTVSSAPIEEKKSKYVSYDEYAKTYKTDEEKKEEVRKRKDFFSILLFLSFLSKCHHNLSASNF